MFLLEARLVRWGDPAEQSAETDVPDQVPPIIGAGQEERLWGQALPIALYGPSE